MAEFSASLDDALERDADGLVIDLSEVGFIDSSGLGVIVAVDARLRQERRSLAVIAPRGSSAAVLFTLAGLRRSLAVFDSRRAALRR